MNSWLSQMSLVQPLDKTKLSSPGEKAPHLPHGGVSQRGEVRRRIPSACSCHLEGLNNNFEQGDPHFGFAQCPANVVTSPNSDQVFQSSVCRVSRISKDREGESPGGSFKMTGPL